MRLTFEISDEAYDLLIRMKDGAFEYRDTEYPTKEDFLNSSYFEGNGGMRSLESFLARNMDGTYYLIEELYSNGLVQSDEMSWNPTYIITAFGKKVI